MQVDDTWVSWVVGCTRSCDDVGWDPSTVCPGCGARVAWVDEDAAAELRWASGGIVRGHVISVAGGCDPGWRRRAAAF